MKRATKKLALNRSTVRQLDAGRVAQIRGGTLSGLPWTGQPRPSGICHWETGNSAVSCTGGGPATKSGW